MIKKVATLEKTCENAPKSGRGNKCLTIAYLDEWVSIQGPDDEIKSTHKYFLILKKDFPDMKKLVW